MKKKGVYMKRKLNWVGHWEKYPSTASCSPVGQEAVDSISQKMFHEGGRPILGIAAGVGFHHLKAIFQFLGSII